MLESNGTRQRNLLLILKTIDEAGRATAATITEQTGLSVATISRGLGILKAKKLVVQRQKDTTEVGRRPEVFSINPSYGYYLYFCLDSGQLRAYLLDLTGRTVARATAEASPRSTVEDLLELIRALSDRMLMNKTRVAGKLLAVYMAVPGLTDATSGIVSRIPNYPNFESVNLGDRIRDALRLPCFVHNSSRLTALGEYLQNGGSAQSMVYVDITTGGIGSGIILGGQLYEGRNCLAGEIGEMVVHANRCSDRASNNQGALEEEAGLGAVYQRVSRLLQEGHARQLKSLMEQRGVETPTLTMMEKAAAELDLDVFEVLNQATKAWAAAIINISALLSPDVVVVGGAVNESNSLVIRMIRNHLERMYYWPIHLQFAKKNADAHVCGAAHLCRSYLFSAALDVFPDAE